MIKICHVLSTLDEGGPVIQSYNVLSNLSAEFKPYVVTLSPEPNTSMRTRFEIAGVEVVSLNLPRRNLIRLVRKFNQAIGRINPDIVHSHGFRADVLSATFLSNYVHISTVHTSLSMDYQEQFTWLKKNVVTKIHQLALSRANTLIGCSEYVARTLPKSRADIEIIRNGIDHHRYKPAKNSDKAELSHALNIDSYTNIFLTIGKFIERKRIDTTVEGFLESRLSDDCALICVGSGSLQSEFKEKYQSNRVRFPGFVKDVGDYLAIADYFVSSSAGEGLPLAVLEALGCGLPVCLSDIDPHREILSFNDSAGVLHSVDDAHSCSVALHNLVSKDYKLASNAARSIIEQHLSANNMATKYEALYKSKVLY